MPPLSLFTSLVTLRALFFRFLPQKNQQLIQLKAFTVVVGLTGRKYMEGSSAKEE